MLIGALLSCGGDGGGGEMTVVVVVVIIIMMIVMIDCNDCGSLVVSYHGSGDENNIVGHGGALVESITFNRRVVGLTPVLAAT